MAAYKGGESFYRDTGPKRLHCYVVGGPISILVLTLLSGLSEIIKSVQKMGGKYGECYRGGIKGDEFDQNTL